MARNAPPARLPKELDLSTAFALTRKLVVTADDDNAHAVRPGLGKAVSYWLWRLGGRRRPAMTDMSHLAKLADNYDTDLARQRARVAQLERLTAQLQTAFDRKLVDLRERHARELADAKSSPDPGAWEARAVAAEDRARLAENKVELLKDALENARAQNGGRGPADTRFRDVKRAFARLFHPDQGGRDDADKQRMFLEFWPVLERIERED